MSADCDPRDPEWTEVSSPMIMQIARTALRRRAAPPVEVTLFTGATVQGRLTGCSEDTMWIEGTGYPLDSIAYLNFL